MEKNPEKKKESGEKKKHKNKSRTVPIKGPVEKVCVDKIILEPQWFMWEENSGKS